MLATASERFPRGGALLMGLMGTAGTLSIQFVLPLMDAIFDHKKVAVAGGPVALQALPPGPALERVLGIAAQTSFRSVAILPAILLVVFGAIWLFDRSRGVTVVRRSRSTTSMGRRRSGSVEAGGVTAVAGGGE